MQHQNKDFGQLWIITSLRYGHVGMSNSSRWSICIVVEPDATVLDEGEW